MKFAPWRSVCAQAFEKKGFSNEASIVSDVQTRKTELAHVMLNDNTTAVLIDAAWKKDFTVVDALTKGVFYCTSSTQWWKDCFRHVKDANTFDALFTALPLTQMREALMKDWLSEGFTHIIELMFCKKHVDVQKHSQWARKMEEFVITIPTWNTERVYAFVQSAQYFTNIRNPIGLHPNHLVEFMEIHPFENLNATEQHYFFEVLSMCAKEMNMTHVITCARHIPYPTIVPWLVSQRALLYYGYAAPAYIQELEKTSELDLNGASLAKDMMLYALNPNTPIEHPWLKTMHMMDMQDNISKLLHPETTPLRHNGVDFMYDIEEEHLTLD